MGALAAALLSMSVPSKYEASSSITMSDPSGNVSVANMLAVVNDLTQSRIVPYETDESEIKVSTEMGTGAAAQTLVITVEGPVETECVELANSIASGVAIDAKKVFDALQEANEAELADLSALNASEDVAAVLSGALLQDVLGSNRTFEFCSFMVREAVEARDEGAGLSTLAVVGLMGGLFLAIAVIVVIDIMKRPIINREELERALELPVLNVGEGSDLGAELWANIQFVAAGAVDSVCLVPLDSDSANECAEFLMEAIAQLGRTAQVHEVSGNDFSVASVGSSEISIYSCAPLNRGVGAAYCAHAASVTVICARTWRDSFKTLENAMRELSIANANVVGVALLDG